EGERLFDVETFGGNGRTCGTCHMKETGTITVESVVARHTTNPGDPLFRHDGLDNGGAGTDRIRTHATIRVELPLPPHISIQGDPGKRTIVVNRGVPSTLDAPAFDGGTASPTLMLDLRNASLEEQALGAIQAHAQNTVPPTSQQLSLIGLAQKLLPRFFSSTALFQFATGAGSPPTLPACNTAAECRGRTWFENVPVVPGSNAGRCGVCHSGPMLNETSIQIVTPLGVTLLPGAKFANVRVAERNALNNPVHTFLVDNGSGDIRTVMMADPGMLLTNPLPASATFGMTLTHPAQLAGFFKTLPLRNIRNTAPYFHDNSAKSLRAVAEHYATHFFLPLFGITLSEQDLTDLVAFMMRL
ncbi:MAG: hypothetical protein ABR602_09425, partial [Gemmatimonadales bacterium]